MLAEPSAVTGRWCMIYLCTVLIATCLDSSQTPFLILVVAQSITATLGQVLIHSPLSKLLTSNFLYLSRWLVLNHLGIHTLYMHLEARAEWLTQ